MKIVMFTNTFSPHIGGVARSVNGLVRGLREQGHTPLVVAPQFPGAMESSGDVIRMSALQNFTGSDFALPSPVSWSLSARITDFAPDIIHSHHPFLLGGTALRIASAHKVPIIYTSHTRYDLYSHYIIQNSKLMKRLALNLTTGYCDLCDAVIAPSISTSDFLKEQHVKAPISVIPTGVNTAPLENFDKAQERAKLGIPAGAPIIGHVGRLEQEKNLTYLANALAAALQSSQTAHALVVGDGAMATTMSEIFSKAGVRSRVHMTGALTGANLTKAYAVMDVFAFSSKSETQGLVIIEAMATGAPVVALDAPGVREVVESGKNGILLPGNNSTEAFAKAISSILGLDSSAILSLRAAASAKAGEYSQDKTVQRTLDLYQSTINDYSSRNIREHGLWKSTTKKLADQWNIFGNVANAVSDALLKPETGDD